MNKYIPADKLISEIERRIGICKRVTGDERNEEDMKRYYQGKVVALEEIRHLADSLQQEQPDMDLDKLVNEEFASHCRTTEYGLEVTYNRAELYQLIKRMALVFNARKEVQP